MQSQLHPANRATCWVDRHYSTLYLVASNHYGSSLAREVEGPCNERFSALDLRTVLEFVAVASREQSAHLGSLASA